MRKPASCGPYRNGRSCFVSGPRSPHAADGKIDIKSVETIINQYLTRDSASVDAAIDRLEA